jgi:ankyrin repeat protein
VKDDLIINGQDKYGWTPLHCACHHGNIACVELLLKLGASATKVNKQGKTPFHLASAQCRSEIVALLLQHDASIVNIKDNMDMTALIDAAFRGHKTVYYQLLEVEGIDVNHKDRLGYSAADYFEGRAIAK